MRFSNEKKVSGRQIFHPKKQNTLEHSQILDLIKIKTREERILEFLIKARNTIH